MVECSCASAAGSLRGTEFIAPLRGCVERVYSASHKDASILTCRNFTPCCITTDPPSPLPPTFQFSHVLT